MSDDLLGRLRARLAEAKNPTLRTMLCERIRELDPAAEATPPPLPVSPSGRLETEHYPFVNPPRRWMRRRGESLSACRARNEAYAAAHKDDDDAES